MLRNDKLTIERKVYELVSGEAKYIEPLIVAKDIPCHLSVGLVNTAYFDNIPYLVSNYIVFLDYSPNIDIKENDTLYVQTNKKEVYKLKAGEIKKYNLTIQIKCALKKIIES